ncbi:MAG: hypothetical protein AAF567_14065 [Actinomycetota bacterium]
MAVLTTLSVALLLSACNGGPRPILVAPPAAAEVVLELDLPPAPASVGPLPPAPEELTLESSVDDALIAWATNRQVPYTDSCRLITPEPGELCDQATERDDIRLLGPSADEIWYVVTVSESTSFDFGTGYRVSNVEIAGR